MTKQFLFRNSIQISLVVFEISWHSVCEWFRIIYVYKTEYHPYFVSGKRNLKKYIKTHFNKTEMLSNTNSLQHKHMVPKLEITSLP